MKRLPSRKSSGCKQLHMLLSETWASRPTLVSPRHTAWGSSHALAAELDIKLPGCGLSFAALTRKTRGRLSQLRERSVRKDLHKIFGNIAWPAGVKPSASVHIKRPAKTWQTLHEYEASQNPSKSSKATSNAWGSARSDNLSLSEVNLDYPCHQAIWTCLKPLQGFQETNIASC